MDNFRHILAGYLRNGHKLNGRSRNLWRRLVVELLEPRCVLNGMGVADGYDGTLVADDAISDCPEIPEIVEEYETTDLKGIPVDEAPGTPDAPLPDEFIDKSTDGEALGGDEDTTTPTRTLLYTTLSMTALSMTAEEDANGVSDEYVSEEELPVEESNLEFTDEWDTANHPEYAFRGVHATDDPELLEYEMQEYVMDSPADGEAAVDVDQELQVMFFSMGTDDDPAAIDGNSPDGVGGEPDVEPDGNPDEILMLEPEAVQRGEVEEVQPASAQNDVSALPTAAPTPLQGFFAWYASPENSPPTKIRRRT